MQIDDQLNSSSEADKALNLKKKGKNIKTEERKNHPYRNNFKFVKLLFCVFLSNHPLLLHVQKFIKVV